MTSTCPRCGNDTYDTEHHRCSLGCHDTGSGRPPRPKTGWGARLLKLRRSRRWSRAELAPIFGVAEATLGHYESGYRDMPTSIRALLILLEGKSDDTIIDLFNATREDEP